VTAAVKKLGFAAIAALSWIYRLLPWTLRRFLVFGLAALESRIGPPEASLRRLFRLQDDIEKLINERAMALGRGEHPKHRLTKYHDFFIERIPRGARVLDIGCGYGAVARSIARRVEAVQVTGIDFDRRRIAEATAADNPPNLTFVSGDALDTLPDGPWDTVVLSNILEHIERRVDFLRRIMQTARPRRVLIRVPLFERNWQIALRKELGVEYFSDPTHHIEHTLEQFDREIEESGLETVMRSTLWGEIWAECRPQGQPRNP